VKTKWLKFIGVFLLLLIFDAALKYHVFTSIPKMSFLHPFYPYGGIGVFKDFLGIQFSINHVENLGAAWGMLSEYSTLLFYVRVVVVLCLMVYLVLFNRVRRREFPLLLIITGAVGNILDYILYGHVIDMFHFKFWNYSYPVFNLADAMITIGIIWLLVLSFVSSKKS